MAKRINITVPAPILGVLAIARGSSRALSTAFRFVQLVQRYAHIQNDGRPRVIGLIPRSSISDLRGAWDKYRPLVAPRPDELRQMMLDELHPSDETSQVIRSLSEADVMILMEIIERDTAPWHDLATMEIRINDTFQPAIPTAHS